VYELVWGERAEAELAALRPFLRRIVLAAAESQLRYQPDVETRNRKPLREPLPEVPDAAWELRIRGAHRLLYRIADASTVRVLRVILKGPDTLAEAVGDDHE
jgi:plasmid stabilization system protein ParE